MSTSSTHPDTTIYQRPVELLQHLIRFNTTNPPGNEAECIKYIDALLTEAGFQTTLLANDPARPNLITRLPGHGNARPLLLQGHIDVVTTEKQTWQQPPFEGRVVDNYVWGRGTLDMKGGVAMMLTAIMRAKAEGISLPGDVVLTLLSDEEAGGEQGAEFLVENHAELFKDIRYALGEFGGFSITIGGKKFYAIQVLEKQVCWMKAALHGPGGHGSLPMRNGASAKLGYLLQQLNQHRLPVHIIETARQMLETISATIAGPTGAQFRQLLDPAQTDATLDTLSEQRQILDPILHNTVNVTIIRGGSQVNVIPSEITLEMDGRLLPGYTPEDMLAELRRIIGDEAEIEIVRHDRGRARPDMGLFDTLADILREADQDSVPIPFLTPVVTDGRFFSRLGIQTYGFLPLNLPAGFDFLQTIHAADERVPIEAFEFGTQAIFEVLRRPR